VSIVESEAVGAYFYGVEEIVVGAPALDERTSVQESLLA
jgi:hypothetical protein